MPRMTVADLAERTDQQVEDLSNQISDLVAAVQTLAGVSAEPTTQPTPATQEPSGLVPLAEDAAPAAVAEGDFEFPLTVNRQAELSQGGSIRFWAEGQDADEPHGSVYVGGEGSGSYAAKSIDLLIVPVAEGQATIKRQRTKSGTPKATKGRHTWEGRFAYGGMTVMVFFNLPKAEAKTLPDEVGIILDLGA